jgi:choline kinase
MKAIVIAAGLGSRMGSLTDNIPKCMLPINGRPLLHHTMDHMRAAGCDEFIVVVGYKAEQIDAQGATLVHNEEFERNNILHSLMCAADHLEGPVMCSYSDIWVEPEIHRSLVETTGDIVLAIDDDWLPYYEGRMDHPVEEAENAFFDENRRIKQVGKHLHPEDADTLTCGEFLGLWRMDGEGTLVFREAFEELDARLDRDEPFQQAAHWRTAYITDMIQELTNAGTVVDCAVIQRGWAELDTTEDYRRLDSIAERQKLYRFCETRKDSQS